MCSFDAWSISDAVYIDAEDDGRCLMWTWSVSMILALQPLGNNIMISPAETTRFWYGAINRGKQDGLVYYLRLVAGSILECIPFTCTFIVGISIHLISSCGVGWEVEVLRWEAPHFRSTTRTPNLVIWRQKEQIFGGRRQKYVTQYRTLWHVYVGR